MHGSAMPSVPRSPRWTPRWCCVVEASITLTICIQVLKEFSKDNVDFQEHVNKVGIVYVDHCRVDGYGGVFCTDVRPQLKALEEQDAQLVALLQGEEQQVRIAYSRHLPQSHAAPASA